METSDLPIPRWLAVGGALGWRLLAVGGALYVLGQAFTRLEVVIVPVVAALFLSTILAPPATRLRRHGWPPLLATWAVFLGSAALIGGIVAALVPVVTGEWATLSHDVGHAVNTTEAWLQGAPFHVSKAEVTSSVDKLKATFSANKGQLIQGALSGATMLASIVGGILLTFVLTFFFVKDGPVIGEWMASLLDERRAGDLRAVGARAWSVIGGYVRGTAVNGLVNATVLGLGLLVLGVPLVIPIALITFIGAFLPLVGGIASGVLAVLVALAAKGPVAALVMVALTVLIHHLEGYLVGPLVLGRAVRLHPIAVLLSLTIGTILGGVVGAFMAVPVASVALAINEYYRGKRLIRGRADTSLSAALPVAAPH